jgi:hypothetical protein
MMFRLVSIMMLFVVFWPGTALADSTQKNVFASIYLKKKKIGQVHLTSVHGETGEIEELKSRASVSFLGVKVYAFTQHHHETWRGGELQKMVGHTDDNGTAHRISLERTAEDYEGEYNDKPLVIPYAAFPTSPWHYKITGNTLLFNVVNFDLLKVEVSQSPDPVTIGKETIPATKFEFTGDWQARVWFDEAKSFLKAEYDVAGRRVTVVIDP